MTKETIGKWPLTASYSRSISKAKGGQSRSSALESASEEYSDGKMEDKVARSIRWHTKFFGETK